MRGGGRGGREKEDLVVSKLLFTSGDNDGSLCSLGKVAQSHVQTEYIYYISIVVILSGREEENKGEKDTIGIFGYTIRVAHKIIKQLMHQGL